MSNSTARKGAGAVPGLECGSRPVVAIAPTVGTVRRPAAPLGQCVVYGPVVTGWYPFAPTLVASVLRGGYPDRSRSSA
jgi:hypothetical protein